MDITLNRGGLIGAFFLSVYSTLWVYLSLRGQNLLPRMTEMMSNALIAGIIVGAVIGNRVWAMVLDARAAAQEFKKPPENRPA